MMHTLSIAQMAKSLAAGEFTSEQLTRHFLQRIKQYDTDLNSFITITEEQAMAQAKQADELIASNQAGPLTGIPMAHKDIFCTRDIKTSCGSKMLDNWQAPYNATVVQNLADAGTVMLGKCNMDEFAMGSSNETSYYGPVLNPWDKERVPGGSSGGSAASVAARLVPFATATDTGGSIRQPAALCGVTGLKPTYGRVSRYGMIAFASSLDQGGVISASAEDAAYVMAAMAGFDQRDSTSIQQPVDDYIAQLPNDINGLNIGIVDEFFNEGLDDGVRQVVEQAMEVYKNLGANIKTISMPNSSQSVPVYYVVAPAECSSNLSRFDGVRFGHRCEEPKDLEDLYKRSRAEGFGAEVKRRIMIGTYALSAGYYDAYYLKAQQVRHLIQDDFAKAFESVDVIMSPTAPSTAFKLGEKTNDPVTMYLSDIYTISTNLAGLPGISIPAGFSNGLPVGLQIIGNAFKEGQLLNVAHRYQQETDWHQQIPGEYA